MTIKPKYCDYHKKECYIWKNFQGRKYCKEGYLKTLQIKTIQEAKDDNCQKDKQEGEWNEIQSNDRNSKVGSKNEKSTFNTKVVSTKKKDLKIYIDILDKLLRLYMLSVYPPKCFTCDYIPKDIKELQVGHFIGRSCYGLRWSLDNVKLQCVECNVHKYGNLTIYEDRLGNTIPEQLREQSKKIYKLDETNLLNKITELKTKTHVSSS